MRSMGKLSTQMNYQKHASYQSLFCLSIFLHLNSNKSILFYRKLQDLLIPMLAGLMENNYDSMWSFQEFFDHSSYICDLVFLNIMCLDTCQIIQLPFHKTEK